MTRLNQLVWPASMSAFGDKADFPARSDAAQRLAFRIQLAI
jgi:hypothetical protein